MKASSLAAIALLTASAATLAAQSNKQPTATVYHYDRKSGLSRVGTFSFDDIWKQSVDQRIADELAHRGPDYRTAATSKRAWQQWYAILRSKRTVGWTPSQFKTSEDMVRYIKRKRSAKGLPVYDP